MVNNSTFYDGLDRRERSRYKVKANCSSQCFNPIQFSDQFNVFKVDNIGPGGLAFFSDQPFEQNTRIFITIAFKEYFSEEPIDAVGEIIWVHPVSYMGRLYRVGVKFIKMLEDDQMNLTRHFNPMFAPLIN